MGMLWQMMLHFHIRSSDYNPGESSSFGPNSSLSTPTLTTNNTPKRTKRAPPSFKETVEDYIAYTNQRIQKVPQRVRPEAIVNLSSAFNDGFFFLFFFFFFSLFLSLFLSFFPSFFPFFLFPSLSFSSSFFFFSKMGITRFNGLL